MHYTFNVYNNGKLVDTCFANYPDAQEMRASLINHDGYDSTITVRRVWRSEFVVQGDYGYGHGWEDLCSESSRKEALARLSEYRDNERSATHRLICRKVQA
jgi:hypothetical protein